MMVGKSSKASVDYGPAKAGSAEHCGVCVNFEPHDRELPTCAVVTGHVRRQDWCTKFKAKA